MRKISLVLVAVMLLFTGSIFANNINSEPTKSLSAQIFEILEVNEFNDEVIGQSAQVRFTLNNEGEIVVMSVDTKDISLESFVKGRLNYKKVELENVVEGKLYTILIRVAG